MLGPDQNRFTDLDRVGESGSAARTASSAYGGPTSQNIDLSNVDFDSSTRPMAARDGTDNDNPATAAQGDNTTGSGMGNNMYNFDYMPTPFNPAKTDRCLLENVVLLIVLCINIVLGIASVATAQLQYREPNLTIVVYAATVHGCLLGECSPFIYPDVFCRRYLQNSAGYLACIIIAIIFSLVALIFSVCNVLGRACISKYLVIALSAVAWIFFLVSVICLSTLKTSKLCRGVSLGAMGFKYGPAFPLVLTLFILFSLSILFYIFMRVKRPVRYSYN